MLLNVLEKQYNNAIKKNWDKLYIFVDIHDTVIVGNYSETVLPTEFCPEAKEALQYLSQRKDVVLILYTCSWPTEVVKYQEFFKEYGIIFKYCNENPDVMNNRLGYYSQKPYFNVLLEDKAGFVPETDWPTIVNFFKTRPILELKQND